MNENPKKKDKKAPKRCLEAKKYIIDNSAFY